MMHYKSFRRIFTALIILLSFHNESAGINNPDKSFEKVFDLIYKQQFSDASHELTQSKNRLDRWEYHILYLDLLWWEMISDNNANDYDRLESALAKHTSDLRNSKNPDSLEELITLSYSLRLAAIKKNSFFMMVNMYRINRIIERIDTNRLSTEQQEIFKIYTALFNIGKSKLFFFNSKLKRESIKILESNISSVNPVYQTISCYFLSKVYLELDQSPAKAEIYCKQLCKIYPGNKIFIYNLEQCKGTG
ncbi:MAG: hypothetical protein R6U04_04490 [Bacteroidales bacterium]